MSKKCISMQNYNKNTFMFEHITWSTTKTNQTNFCFKNATRVKQKTMFVPIMNLWRSAMRKDAKSKRLVLENLLSSIQK